METNMKTIALFALFGALSAGATQPVYAPNRTVTFGAIGVEQGFRAPDATEATKRYADPQRPRLCPRYVVDPDDPCY
jgi:hypothetical protein